MDKTIFQNKHVTIETFRNPYDTKMFSIKFNVGSGSDDSYRGFSIKKAAKVAKWLKKAAKAVKGLQK